MRTSDPIPSPQKTRNMDEAKRRSVNEEDKKVMGAYYYQAQFAIKVQEYLTYILGDPSENTGKGGPSSYDDYYGLDRSYLISVANMTGDNRFYVDPPEDDDEDEDSV